MLKSRDYLFVGIQFTLLFCLLWDGLKSWRFVVPGYFTPIIFFLMIIGVCLILLAMLQLNTSLSPFPTPKVSGQLITNGIFKFIRHPIYTGIILFSLSWAFVSGSYFRLFISVLLILLFFYKSQYEEGLLIKKFEDYPAYKKRTGRFFPGL